MGKVGGEKWVKFPPKKSGIKSCGARDYEHGRKMLRYIQEYTGIYRGVTLSGLRYATRKLRQKTKSKKRTPPHCVY